MPQQTMYDSVGGVATIPQSAQLILVYIDGAFQTLAIANQTHPFARKILATTLTPGNINAQIFDCEPGNGNANDAALWSLRKLAIFARPTIYCSRASGSPYDYPSVLASLGAHNIPRSSVDIGIADWTGHPHLIPSSAFTQYANPPASGGNYDISLTNGTWPDAPPPPTPTPTPPITKEDIMPWYATASNGAGFVIAPDFSHKVGISDAADGTAIAQSPNVAHVELTDAFLNLIPTLFNA